MLVKSLSACSGVAGKNNLRRLEAQRNELNSKVRQLRQHLSFCVTQVMDQANWGTKKEVRSSNIVIEVNSKMSQFSSVRTMKLTDLQQTQNYPITHPTDLRGEELQLLLEPASNCGEVIKAMGILACESDLSRLD